MLTVRLGISVSSPSGGFPNCPTLAMCQNLPTFPPLLPVAPALNLFEARVASIRASQSSTDSLSKKEKARGKTRAASGTRLPKGIYFVSATGDGRESFRADAGLDPQTKKRRRKEGFETVEEAVKWRDRTLAADAPADQEAINFTATLPLAFGQAILNVQKRFADHESKDAAQQPAGISRQAFVFTPAILDEMAEFWLRRHPKGAHGLLFGPAIDLWLEAKGQILTRKNTIRDIKDGYRFWKRALQDRRCTEITTADLEAVLGPKRSSVGGVRVRNLINKAVDIFGWLQRTGELPVGAEHNPASLVVRPIIDETTPNPFPLDEAAALLSLALQTQAELGCFGYLAVCLFGGSRFTESTKLIWGTHIARESDFLNYQLPEKSAILINPKEGSDDDDEDDELERELILRITADVAKKHRQRLISMPPNLCAILIEMRRRGWIVAGAPVLPSERQMKCFRRFAAANGIAWRANGLRASFGSHFFARTGSLEATIAAMGHTGDTATFRNHYFQLVARKDARAFFRLGFDGLDCLPAFVPKVTFEDFIIGYRAALVAAQNKRRSRKAMEVNAGTTSPLS